MGLLITDGGGPIGGKWSFDPENRRRLPRGHVPPTPWRPPRRTQTTEAIRTVAELFPRAPGVELLQEPSADESASSFEYPVTRADARKSLQDFLDNRLPLFGDYEDAISSEHRVMYHSVITPALNIGLLTPEEVVSAAMARADEGDVPLNSLEGFVRQVIGWREFMHGAYLAEGRSLRAANELGHTGRMPPSFYEGTTGLEPFDATVTRVRRHGWCHHIERLMVLGNLMLLCEIEPAAVFRWFMEYFVDAHDWVMVPNVFGMSQFADGGTLTTKPYVSGSAYLRRMSDYPDGPWRDIWDGLYWRWVRRHRELLESIPRSRVAVRGLERLDRARERRLRRAAEEWLEGRAG